MSIAPAAKAKKLTLVCEAPAAPLVEADAHALLKVLVHLASNAIDNTGEGGTVKIIAKLYPRHMGIHITNARADRLEAPADACSRPSDVANAGGGASLGFAIARSLVELHGGRLRVRSRLDSGSLVVLSLPRQPLFAQDKLHAEAA